MGKLAFCLAALFVACGVRGALGQQGETFLFSYSAALSCPQLSLQALGADATGLADAVPTLARLNTVTDWTSPGIIFVPKGRYAVRTSITISKLVTMEAGSVFDVARGVTLTFTQALSAGAYRIFSGEGNVYFQLSMTAILPEWFGARGDGRTDDTAALNKAFRTANASSTELVLGEGKTYRTSDTIVKGGSVRVFSRPGATLMALKPGVLGMLYETGNHVRPELLPTFRGYSTALKFDLCGQTDCYTPLITDALGLPCNVGIEGSLGATRVKFGTIKNCRTGLWVTTKDPGFVVMQGFTVEGNEFIDTKGVAKNVYLFTAPNIVRPPYWDHNQFLLRKITISPKATGFAVIRSDPMAALPYESFDLLSLGPLPPGGKLLDTYTWDTVMRVTPTAGFRDGQLDYPLGPGAAGDFNSIHMEGPAAAAQSAKPLKLSTRSNSLAAFKLANGLRDTPYANLLTVTVPQNGTRWQAGQLRIFYLYHQLAYLGRSAYYNVPGVGSRCSPDGFIAVVALTDNSDTVNRPANGAITNFKYEVEVEVLACKDIPLTQKLGFKMTAGATSA